MTWKVRVTLSVFTAGLGMFFGSLGGFLGPKLPIWTWFGLTVVLALLLLPWGNVVFSQEEMLTDMKDLNEALDELMTIQPKLKELHKELDACGGLSQEELLHMAARLDEVKEVSRKSQLSLREALFGYFRRTQATQLIAISIAGLGGAIMAYQLALIIN